MIDLDGTETETLASLDPSDPCDPAGRALAVLFPLLPLLPCDGAGMPLYSLAR
jgi:hypothetical protein